MLGYEIGGKDTNESAIGEWSNCKKPWEKDCFYFMVQISSLFFNFVKPWVLYLGKQFIFIEIRCKTLNYYVKLCC